MIVTGIAILVFGFIGIGIISYAGYHIKQWYEKRTSKKKQSALEKDNMLTIVHGQSQGKIFAGSDNSITIKTHMDFVQAYEKLDKSKDISLVIHTVGGALSSAEAITNCILNHKGPGKIICYIPYYSYSGGCMIALACDEIVMKTNAILGPCDAQKPVGSLSVHSIASIIDAVDYKKETKEKINEVWLASSYDAKLCKERQQEYLNNLVKHKKFTEEIGSTIYTEFFSGKYNHDKTFSAQEAKELGINVTIVENMSDKIQDLIDDLD